MPYHKSLSEIILDSVHHTFFAQMDSLYQKKALRGVRNKWPEYDSIVKQLVMNFNEYPAPSKHTGTCDIKNMNADFLIDNIESAFNKWRNNPLLVNLSFDDFKEAILPYRTGNEHLPFTKTALKNKYHHILSQKGMESIRTVIGEYIQYITDLRILYRGATPQGHLGVYDLYMNEFKMNCFNITTWSCNILRASGIPVYFEFTPQYRDRDNPHYWCASPDSTNIPLPYTVPNNNLMDDWESELQYSSKVYRRTYGANRKTPYFTARPDESIPAELAIPTLLDVTWRYHPTITLRVPLDLFIDNNNVYLCTFNTKTELTAVAWGKVDYKKREAIFEQVPINHLFFPAYYVDEEYISFSTPFILTADSLAEIPEPFSDSKPYKPLDLRLKDGKLISTSFWRQTNKHIHHKPIKPDMQKQDILVTRKYPIKRHLSKIYETIRGGILIGYNEKKESDTLYKLPVVPQPYLQEFEFCNKKKYRNYSFIVPGHAVNIAEMEFLGKDIPKEISISPTPLPIFSPCAFKKDTLKKAIGTPMQTGREPYSPFDGNLETYAGGSSIGMNFPKPICVTHIRMAPRNANNMIVKGNRYELMYYDCSWKSAGKQVAKDNYLIFQDVPSNTLYWLKNLDHGKEELPFFYSEGVQYFIDKSFL